MEEFPDELVAKYTRKELEAMAIDLEVDPVGLTTKALLAEAIFEARRMIKEMTLLAGPAEPSEVVVPPEITEEAKGKTEVPPMEAEMAPPEVVSAEKVPMVNLQVGVNGVLAKKAAIDEESRSMHEKALAIQKAGQNMRQDGIKHMHKAIEAQVKENERSIKSFDQGAEEIRIEIGKKSWSMRKKASAIQKAGQNMRQDGIKHMQKRVSEMQKAIDAQVKENERSLKNFDNGVEEIRIDIDKESRSMTKKALEIQKAGQKMRLDGIKQMQKNVGDFKAEIDEFVKLDMENYVKDFYYG